MEERQYDLVVIGSGSAGFAAAIRASTIGRSVAIVEAGTVGGTCVNTGCVPSKALLAAAEARQTAADADRFPGLASAQLELDARALVAGKRELVEWMRAEKYLDLVDYYRWDLYRGLGSFTGDARDPALEVGLAEGGRERLRGGHYLIATGSAPWIPDVPGLGGSGYLTSETAMELDQVPESLLIAGGGFVAVEQAQLFARLGSRVTMLVRSRLLSREEPEVAPALGAVFADEGIDVVRRAVPLDVRADDGGVVVRAGVAGASREFRAAKLLVATGRRAVTSGLNLSAVGIETGPRGEVPVDTTLRTANPRIWAAGDVTGHPEYVYVAAAHGSIAAENALAGAGRTVGYDRLPRVAFTGPAVAAVGLTDREATARGIACDCRVLPLELVPRALVNRDTRGFIKLVAEQGSGRLLGMTAVARDAGELAAAGVHLLEAGTTVGELAGRWAPYLTMAEGLKLAAESYTQDVALLSCCAV
ncbi:mercury(II) reductase [Sinomonas sp. P47F7]|uniref:mercury(II) reductase n=1 Tax=Sinomonas sp. P47F7 TaxID=3410987 RepID=UPI003BF52C82